MCVCVGVYLCVDIHLLQKKMTRQIGKNEIIHVKGHVTVMQQLHYHIKRIAELAVKAPWWPHVTRVVHPLWPGYKQRF